jgi:hypothetical protein
MKLQEAGMGLPDASWEITVMVPTVATQVPPDAAKKGLQTTYVTAQLPVAPPQVSQAFHPFGSSAFMA